MRKEVALATLLTTAGTVLGLAALVKQWKQGNERRRKQAQRILRKFARECATPVAKLWHVANDLASKMQADLASNEGKVGMLLAYTAPLPTGDEKGSYYGINLRGTNFLITEAQLGGKNEPVSEVQRQEVQIPPNIMNGDSKELFDFIALELAKFISLNNETTNETQGRSRKLGFTISLPVEQVSVSTGTAIKWKNLSVDDTVGKDLRIEINQALQRRGIEMQVFQLADDTIGDLAGGRYYNKDCVAAVSLGMGTDVAYVESAQSIPKWKGKHPESGEIVINLQWGDFRSSHLPLTEFDTSLDVESANPGSRIFEKLISGMYLGEIVRRTLLKMAKEAAIFGDTVPPKLSVPYLLRSPDMAAMHQDTSEDYEVVDEKLKDIFCITDSTPTVRKLVVEVCDIVAERGARLVGAGIVGIIKKLGRVANKKNVITIEGGLYEHYRIFRNYLHSSVWEMLGNELSDNVIIEHSHGGSGAGAIFLAASQTQYSDS